MIQPHTEVRLLHKGEVLYACVCVCVNGGVDVDVALKRTTHSRPTECAPRGLRRYFSPTRSRAILDRGQDIVVLYITNYDKKS